MQCLVIFCILVKKITPFLSFRFVFVIVVIIRSLQLIHVLSIIQNVDVNGNKLPYNDSTGNCNNFTIQDRDISTVDIYILDYTQYMDELKGPDNYNNNENKPEGQKWSDLLDQYAKYHKTLHFD